MVAWATTAKTWAAGDGTSSQFNAGVRDPIVELRAAIDGTSASITSFSGTGVGAGSPAPTCTKSGDRVFLAGVITDTSPPLTSGTVATLPAGFRPAAASTKYAVAANGGNIANLTITSGGVVTYTAVTGFTSIDSVVLDGISFIGA